MHVKVSQTRALTGLFVTLALLTAVPAFGSSKSRPKVESTPTAHWSLVPGRVGGLRPGAWTGWILDVPLGDPSNTGRLYVVRSPFASATDQRRMIPAAASQGSSSRSSHNGPLATSDTFTNAAGGGNWNNAGNWSAGLPNSGTDALITGTGSAASVIEDVSATINNMTLNSTNSWSLNNGLTLTIDGSSISNAGSMTLNSTGSGTSLDVAAANVTLSGGGTLTLSNNVNNQIFGAVTADTLTNQETIQGAGKIGGSFGTLTLVNSGTINANQSAGMTIDAAGGATNTGTIKATGGPLLITGTALSNTGGTISATGQTLQVFGGSTVTGGSVTLTGASTLQVNNSTIQSGTLTNSSTGTIEVTSGFASTLGGTISNPSGGVVKIDNGAQLNLQAGSYPSLGAVQLNSSGSTTTLNVAGAAVTLSGGTVTLSNNAANQIVASVTADVLNNQETIQGAGKIGGSFGVLTLANSGTINANQSAGMTIDAAGGVVNTGTITATGGTLLVTGTAVNNVAGTISATGQSLQVTSSTIFGGNVTLTGAATLQMNNSVIESGTLTNSSTGTIEVLSGFASSLGGSITNPTGGLLKIDNGAQLNLQGGTYASLGAVQLNSTGSTTTLGIVGGNVTLSGGTLTLTNNAANQIIGAVSTDTLTNQETITGSGKIGGSFGTLTLVNSGTINANQSAGMTIDAAGGATNSGTIQATGGTLLITGTNMNNLNGTLTATAEALQVTSSTINGGTINLNGASTLQLNNSAVENGTINSNSAGTIEVLAGFASTLSGTITNPAGGVLKVDNGAQLNLQSGTYSNLGTVQVNSTGSTTTLGLIDGNVTLSGGSLTLTNNAANQIVGAVSTDTLTNQETISGAGKIGGSFGVLTLVNSGTINANQSAGLTIDTAGGTVNTGTIQATGGTLGITGTTVTNTGGNITANAEALQVTSSTINGGTITLTGAATLQMNNSVIQSGTLNNSSTGTIEVLSGFASTLGGSITNPSGGVLKIDNGAQLNLQNGSYASLGTMQVNSTGNTTTLGIIGSNVTLSGGTLTLTNNINNQIIGAVTADTLTNQETISGAGKIGGSFGVLTLVNSGTINANQSAGMTLDTAGGTVNIGTIEATGGTLSITGTTVTNAGGNITANGETLQLTTSTINGGSITLTGTATLQMNNSTIHGGSTLSNSSTGTIEVLSGFASTLGGTITNPAGGVLKIDNGATLNLENGTYANLGAVQLNSTGSSTSLIVNRGNVTLSGGTVTLTNNANNFITGAVSTDLLTNQETIQGSGNIGRNSMGLINSGTIIANQSTPLILQPDGLGFTNNGTLQVNTGDVLHVETGPFTNFISPTLTGGTYNISGTLEIDELGTAGGEIVTNAANIILSGATSSFIDAGSKDALSNLATNAATGSFTIQSGRNFTTVGNFTNNGSLTVGSGSKFTVPTGSSLTNFSGTTLTGGTYNITGTLQFPGANIVTNAANITLTGTTASIIDQNSNNGLAGFNNNAAGASFTINGGANFTTAANFTNNGTLTVGSSNSIFKVNGNLTNISGTTISGGTYNLTGALKANNASGLTTNSANITLTGTAGAIQNQSGVSAITGLATNSAGASFTINSGANFTTAAAFTNSGTLTVGSGSIFTSTGNYTATGATTVQAGGIFSGSATISGAGTFTNSGTVQASAGKTLDLKSSVANTGGTILASGASTIALLDAGTITGGTLTSSNGGVIQAQNSATLNGSTNAVTISTGSTLQVNNGQTLKAKGTITNNGAMSLNSTGTNTTLQITANTTLGGTGTLTLSNNAGNIVTGSAGTNILTNAGIIQGSGKLGNGVMGLVNSGTINANQSTSLIINTSTSGFNNTGTLNVSSGDTLQMTGTGPFKNLTGTTLSGGIYNVSGTLQYNSASDIVTNSANITLTGASAKITDQNSNNALSGLATVSSTGLLALNGGQVLTSGAANFTNSGSVTVGSGSKLTLSNASGKYTQTAGTTTVDGTLTAPGGSTISSGSVFGNGGTWSGNVTNSGTFNVGDASLAAGSESITGTYTQNSTGALDIDIGGTSAGTFDTLTVSGAASLNGTLNLDLINGFVPAIGAMFDILNASTLNGTTFATVTGTGINSNEHFTVIYNSNNVTLNVVAGMGSIGQGLPSNSPTPEPASLLLLATGLLGIGAASRRKSKASARKSATPQL